MGKLYFGNVFIWLVRKLNSIWRFIVDFRREMNKVLILIDDGGYILNILVKIRFYVKFFFVLDIVNRFWFLLLKEIY